MAAVDYLNPDQYRGLHQPHMDDPGIHEMEKLFPEDVYTHPHFYGHGRQPYEHESYRQLRTSRGDPEAMIDVYRAVPKSVTSINTGDWVTTSRRYADQHVESELHDVGGHVLHAQVPAQHVRSGGNDIIEWGYAGPSIKVARQMPARRPAGFRTR